MNKKFIFKVRNNLNNKIIMSYLEDTIVEYYLIYKAAISYENKKIIDKILIQIPICTGECTESNGV